MHEIKPARLFFVKEALNHSRMRGVVLQSIQSGNYMYIRPYD